MHRYQTPRVFEGNQKCPSWLIRERDTQLLQLHRITLVQIINAGTVDVVVKNVTLLRNESRFSYLVSQVAFVCLDVSTCGRDDIFFDHDRAHVVGAETERTLPEL